MMIQRFASWTTAAALCLLLQTNVAISLVTPKKIGSRNQQSRFAAPTFAKECHEEEKDCNNVGVGTTKLGIASLSRHSVDRRQVCGVILSTAVLLPTLSAQAAVGIIYPPTSASLETGLLESRVNENVLSPPTFGMEGPDIFYPSWFAGTWTADSRCTSVEAPCGIPLFGSNRTYQSAQAEIGTSLVYDCRFVVSSSSGNDATAVTQIVTADREFNVKSIAKAALGPNSVVDVPLVTPNKFSCVLAPVGSPSLLKVDLITLNRRQETISDTEFHCSEVVREIVAPVGSQAASTPTNPILKEVETTSLYTFDPSRKNGSTIQCRQRSATFLLPSQSSEMQMRMFAASRGRPVDVRFYNVVYTKR